MERAIGQLSFDEARRLWAAYDSWAWCPAGEREWARMVLELVAPEGVR